MAEDVKVTLGEKEWVVAPLNFKAIKKYAPFLDKMKSGISFVDMGVVSDLVYDALVRKNPEITKDFVDENLDLSNSKAILSAVLQASGAIDVQAGE